MTTKGGKNGNVGGFGGYNAVSVFSGGVNQVIMPSKRGRYTVHLGNVGLNVKAGTFCA